MLLLPEQTVELPVIVPGCDGTGVTVTASVRGVEPPQELFAVTEIFPLVALAVALMEVVVELPDQPEGNTQVYEVAPLTGEML